MLIAVYFYEKIVSNRSIKTKQRVKSILLPKWEIYISLSWYSSCDNCYVDSFVQTTLDQFRTTLKSLWFTGSNGFRHVFVGK